MMEQSHSEYIDRNSAFHKDNFMPVTIIQLSRIYDILVVIARGINKQETEQMIELHKMGITLSPNPSFNIEE